jgi:hypothetical protein
MPRIINFIPVETRLPSPTSGPRLRPGGKILVEVQRKNGKVLVSQYAGYHLEAKAFDDEPDPGDPYIPMGYKVVGWKPVPKVAFKDALREHEQQRQAFRNNSFVRW